MQGKSDSRWSYSVSDEILAGHLPSFHALFVIGVRIVRTHYQPLLEFAGQNLCKLLKLVILTLEDGVLLNVEKNSGSNTSHVNLMSKLAEFSACCT